MRHWRAYSNTVDINAKNYAETYEKSKGYPLIKDTPIKWQPDFSLPLHPFTAIIWSLLFGLIFCLLILGILPLARKISPRTLRLVRKILPR